MGGGAPAEGAGVGALRHRRGWCRQEQACSGLGPLPELHLPFCGAGQGSTALPGGPGKSAGSWGEKDQGGMCPEVG